MKEKFDKLYEMLYSSDLETNLLSVSLIKEDPDFNWIYTQAEDFEHYRPSYDINYFNFFQVTDINIIILHRVRFVIADELNKNGKFN